MKVEVITLFPEFFTPMFEQSILRRARDAGLLEIEIHDLRRFTTGPHQQADDYIYGGGAGMLLMPQPFFDILGKIVADSKPRPLIIYPTAQGSTFKQADAKELSRESHLIFICGHYKGIDQRVIERWVDREYSIGDYVLTGGEIPSLAIIDAAVRLIPGVLGDIESALDDSFEQKLLGYSNYTRPESLDGIEVPEVLLSGHHARISRWRWINSFLRTNSQRPDLLSETQEK